MPVKILQITDCHLGEVEGDTLLGMNADRSLDLVLAEMFAVHPQADLLALTGDLSNEAGSSAYHRLSGKIPSHYRQAWLPGNHDDNACMVSSMPESVDFLPTLDMGAWQVTLLDSSIPRKVPGRIEDAELKRMVDILESHSDKHHLFFMHHPLKPVGCAWLDTQVIFNADEVLGILEKYPQLKFIACGHVHQNNHQKHAHIHLYTSPSTCIQFKENSDEFAIGDEMPGYRLIELFDDGTFTTSIHRIAQAEFNIDHDSTGY